MGKERRAKILQELNALDAGPTEEDRRAMREQSINTAIQVEDALKWGRLTVGLGGGSLAGSAVRIGKN